VLERKFEKRNTEIWGRINEEKYDDRRRCLLREASFQMQPRHELSLVGRCPMSLIAARLAVERKTREKENEEKERDNGKPKTVDRETRFNNTTSCTANRSQERKVARKK